MKLYTVYNSSTGEIVKSGICSDDDLQNQAQDGEVVVEGDYSDDTHYFVSGSASEKPQKPSEYHVWDTSSNSWVLDTALIAAQNKLKRNDLLLKSDWTQGNDSPLSQSQKQSWATYRTSLRDITSLASWPDIGDDEWPTEP